MPRATKQFERLHMRRTAVERVMTLGKTRLDSIAQALNEPIERERTVAD